MTLAEILQTYSARVLSTAAAEHYGGGPKNLQDGPSRMAALSVQIVQNP